MRYCSLLNFLGGLAFWFFHRFPRPLRTYRGFAFRTLIRILCSTACRPATTRSDRTQFAPSYSSPDRPTPAQVSEPASILQHLYVSIMFNINGHEHPPKQMLIMSHFCRFWTLPCLKEPDNILRQLSMFFNFSKTTHGNISRCTFSSAETRVSDWTTKFCLHVFIFMPEY